MRKGTKRTKKNVEYGDKQRKQERKAQKHENEDKDQIWKQRVQTRSILPPPFRNDVLVVVMDESNLMP
jgi:hypothetical protein